MKLEQISVFLENRPGGLAEITGALSRAGVNIRALSLADTADFGILRLIVDRNEIAIRVLKESGFTVGLTEMVALEIPDRIGGLWKILTLLEDAGMNVEYMYAFVQKAGENAVILFRFDEPTRAAQLLRGAGVRVLEGEDVHAM
jgi:hypothetical protein